MSDKKIGISRCVNTTAQEWSIRVVLVLRVEAGPPAIPTYSTILQVRDLHYTDNL